MRIFEFLNQDGWILHKFVWAKIQKVQDEITENWHLDVVMEHTWKLLFGLVKDRKNALFDLNIFLSCEPHFKKLLIKIFEFLEPSWNILNELLHKRNFDGLWHAFKSKSHITLLDIDSLSIAVHVIVNAVVIVALINRIFIFLCIYLECVFGLLFLAPRFFGNYRGLWLEILRVKLCRLFVFALRAASSVAILLWRFYHLLLFFDFRFLFDQSLEVILLFIEALLHHHRVVIRHRSSLSLRIDSL